MTAHNFTKQELHFCGQYALTGNGTRSAKDAGFPEKSAHVTASRLLKKDYIQEKIAQLQDGANKELVENTNISRAYVIKRLIKLTDKAEKAGNRAAAINALQWLGKSLAMFTDRVENTQSMTTEEALAQLDGVGDIGLAIVEHIIEGRPADDETLLHLVNSVLTQGAAARQTERGDGQRRVEAPGSQSTH